MDNFNFSIPNKSNFDSVLSGKISNLLNRKSTIYSFSRKQEWL